MLLLVSCNSEPEEGEIPESLEEKRALLKKQKAELKTLTDQVAQLEAAIEAQDPKARPQQFVSTTQAIRKDFKHYVEIQGQVEAEDHINAAAETSGRILKLLVEEGDYVRRGQLIAELDVEQLRKQYEEVETSLELAATVFERQSRLWEQNIGSEIQYLEAKNNKERLEKSLEALQVQLNKSKVHAPASGIVDDVLLEAGELASPGAPLIRILDTSRLKVVADVPETYLRSVSRGEEIMVRYPVLDQEETARISLIGRTIDPANRTFEVEARVGRAVKGLKPNLLAAILINDETIEDVVTVPLDLIQQEVSGKEFIMVMQKGEGGAFAKKQYVQTGDSFEGEIVVESGLTGDEILILEGARGLADGQAIKVVQPKTTAENE